MQVTARRHNRTAAAATLAVLLTLGALAPVPARAALETYVVDPEHTAVTFTIRHFFSKVPGRFTKFDGAIRIDRDDLAAGAVEFSIETASIDTNDESRDRHLRSDAFFDAEGHPTITFKSTRVKTRRNKQLEVTGNLTIRGITKQVKLEVDVLGFGEYYGAEHGAFEVRTTIDRDDFDVSWNDVIEGGGFILGNEVTIVINLQAKKQKPQTASK